MRIFLVLLVFFLCINCENKQSSKHALKNEDKVNNNFKPSTNNTTLQSEFPVLTDENAMEFFLEYEKHHKENKVRIETDFGTIDLLLYDKTKFHRANFIYLTKREYFDYTQFYRVVNNFVIQGGNSDGMELAARREKIGQYLLPPDTKRGYTHKRGAVSMPSSEIEDAYKLASPYQFFIVQNKKGAHHLDGGYTVFGEVIRGMEVVDKIAAVPTDEGEWPLENVYIKSVRIIN